MKTIKLICTLFFFFNTLIAANFDEDSVLIKSRKRKNEEISIKDSLFKQLEDYKNDPKYVESNCFNFRTLQKVCNCLIKISADTVINKKQVAKDVELSEKSIRRVMDFLSHFDYISIEPSKLSLIKHNFTVSEKQKEILIELVWITEFPSSGHSRPFVKPDITYLNDNKKNKLDLIFPSNFIYFIDKDGIDKTEQILNSIDTAKNSAILDLIQEMEELFSYEQRDREYNAWFNSLGPLNPVDDSLN